MSSTKLIVNTTESPTTSTYRTCFWRWNKGRWGIGQTNEYERQCLVCRSPYQSVYTGKGLSYHGLVGTVVIPNSACTLNCQGCGKKMARSVLLLVTTCAVVFLSRVHLGNSQCDGKSVLIWAIQNRMWTDINTCSSEDRCSRVWNSAAIARRHQEWHCLSHWDSEPAKWDTETPEW